MKQILSTKKKSFGIFGAIIFCLLLLTLFPVEKYEKIDLRSAILENDRDFPGPDIFSPITDSDGLYTGRGASVSVTTQRPGHIKLRFREPIAINGFSLFFFGNLDSVSSAMPRNFQVIYYDSNGERTVLEEIKNYGSPVYRFLSKKEVRVTGVEILISKAAYTDKLDGGTVWYRDFSFYVRKPTTLLTSIRDFIGQNNRKLLAFWIYYLIFFFFLFIPGYVGQFLLAKKRRLDLSPNEKLIFSPLLALIVIPPVVSLYLFSGIDLFLYIYGFIFFVSLVIFIRARLYREFFANKTLLLVMAISLFVVSLTIAQREYLFNMQLVQPYLDTFKQPPVTGYPGYHADNTFPWKIAQVFLHRLDLYSTRAKDLLTGTTVFDRTPILPMLITTIMKYFGESHFVYQRFLETLTVLYYGTFFVLIKKYFSKKVALITLLLMWTNVQLSFMSFNVELYYKYFAIYPVLLAVTLVIKDKTNRSLAVSLLVGLAFLIHPFTIIPSSVIIILDLVKYRLSREFVRRSIGIVIVLSILCAGWFLIPKLSGLSKTAGRGKNIYVISASKFEGNMLVNKTVNIINLFIPNSPLKKVGSPDRLSMGSSEYKQEIFRFSFISNLTPVLFVLLLVYLIKNKARDYPIILFGLGPLLTFWLLYLQQYNQHFNYGGSYFLLYPFTLPFLFSYLTNNIVKERVIFRCLIFMAYALYMFFILYYVSWVFNKMNPISLMSKGLFWLIIFTFILLSVYLVKYGATDRE